MLKRFNKLAKISLICIYFIIIAGAVVRMTGSGSAMIAYFSSSKLCKQAEKKVKTHFKKYWCKRAKTM